ncbi:MAG: nickel pincer cofactor biosynthesis protein LarC [Polyangiaceae bacterium]|nr:nickel pincer cofactor biosynthesis protein LarC [Polyangiaceae bacterium]
MTKHADHGHSHAQPEAVDPLALADQLAQASGRGKILFVDAFSGVAGDMLTAALVDLGVPYRHMAECLAVLPLEGYRAELERCSEGSIGALRFHVHVDGPQPERSFATIDAMLRDASLPEPCKVLSRRVFRHLAEAEGQVHGVPPDEVHFHEVGAVDSIVDIVAVCAGLTWLGASVLCTPLPMGRGTVLTRHGRLPLPAPATVACLKGVPTVPADLEAELVTPTGAAVVAVVASDYVSWPSFTVERVGWGAGSRELPGRPNVLRLVLGEPLSRVQSPASSASMQVVEANIDDMSGELAAHAIDALLGAGAVDAWAVPTTTKKGRPGLVLSALVPSEAGDRVLSVLLSETTTIGARRYSVERTERPRRQVIVQTEYGSIPLKVSEGSVGPAQVKPEFDACVQAARAARVPVRVVLDAARAAFRRG